MPSPDPPPAALVLERADRLAACTEEPGRLTRRFATPALAAAGGLLLGGVRGGGMTLRLGGRPPRARVDARRRQDRAAPRRRQRHRPVGAARRRERGHAPPRLAPRH